MQDLSIRNAAVMFPANLDDVEADERLRHARPAAEVAAVVLGVPRLHAAHRVLDVLPDLVCTVTS